MENNETRFGFRSVVEILAFAGLVLQALVVAGTWNSLPELIPVHFDLSGSADRWGDRTDLLLLLTLSAALYAGLTWMQQYPHKFNYPWKITPKTETRHYRLATGFVRTVKLQAVWLFALISLQTILVAQGRSDGLGLLFVPIVLAVLTATGSWYFWRASRLSFESEG